MTNYRNRDRAQKAPPSGNQPTHIAKVRIGQGDNVSFERIGVAWAKEDGSLYIRLHGTQIISGGLTLYPIEEGAAQ